MGAKMIQLLNQVAVGRLLRLEPEALEAAIIKYGLFLEDGYILLYGRGENSQRRKLLVRISNGRVITDVSKSQMNADVWRNKGIIKRMDWAKIVKTTLRYNGAVSEPDLNRMAQSFVKDMTEMI